ncbi:hypothetical protein GCM10025879_09200 [Leuconostoc litchii]|nr:hypothetical protein GCM10025879_09200 [Leuconostoc litchii]
MQVIANVAEGGMRDALSILDQVLAFGFDHVTLENALQVTGSTESSQLISYLQKVSVFDTESALKVLHDILLSGKDATRFVADLLSVLRDVMLAQIAPNLVKTTAPLHDLQLLTSELGTSRIQQMMVTLDDIQKQLLQTMQSDVYLELLTVKLSISDAKEMTHEKVVSKPVLPKLATNKETNSHEKSASDAIFEKEMTVPAKEITTAVSDVNTTTQELLARTGQKAVFAVLVAAKREALIRVKNAWTDLLQRFDVKQQALLTIAEPVAASEEAIVLAFDYPALLEQALQNKILQNQLVAQLKQQALPTEIILISQDEWSSDRATYVTNLRSGETLNIRLVDVPRVQYVNSGVDQPKTISLQEQEIPNDDPKVVSEAKALFGEELVNIVD